MFAYKVHLFKVQLQSYGDRNIYVYNVTYDIVRLSNQFNIKQTSHCTYLHCTEIVESNVNET